MKNDVVLRFCIWGFNDITHDEITNAMGLSPTKIYIIGQKKNPKFTALAKENGWLLEPKCERNSSFESQLISLLNILEQKKEVIKRYCTKYICQISCGVYIYYGNEENIPSINLNLRYNKFVSDLNIEFDVDIYCMPN